MFVEIRTHDPVLPPCPYDLVKDFPLFNAQEVGVFPDIAGYAALGRYPQALFIAKQNALRGDCASAEMCGN